MAGQKNLRIETNADLEFAVRWLGEDGAPFELSEARLQVRDINNTDGDPLIDSIATMSGDPDHWANFLVSAAALEDLPEGDAIYDVVGTRASDDRKKRLLEGRAIISKGVVR